MLLIFLSNVGMGGSASTVVDVRATRRFDIRMPPDDRAIKMAFDDRNISMPPNSRTTKLRDGTKNLQLKKILQL